MANGDVTYADTNDGFPVRMASGSITADISETINVSIGFQPKMIIMTVLDQGETANHLFMWHEGMEDGYFFQILNAGANEHTDMSTVVFACDDDESSGWTLGAAPTGVADGDTIYWVAFG